MSERIQEIIKALREGKKRLSHIAWGNALSPGSKELLDLSGACGEAADLLESLQRETEPVPLTIKQLRKMLNKPIFVVYDTGMELVKKWEIVCLVKKSVHCQSGRYWTPNQFCKIYATEPKGEPKT